MCTAPSVWQRPVLGSVVTVLMVAGCGFGGSPRVHGIVFLDGTPLHSGTVYFHDAFGKSHHAQISDDGEYRMDKDLVVGEVSITVIPDGPVPSGFATPRSNGAGPNTVGKPSIAASDFPKRYMDRSQTDLKYTIVRGDNPHDIRLKR